MISQSSHPIRTIYFDLGSTLVYYKSTRSDSLNQVLNPLVNSLQSAGIHFDEFKLRKLVAEKIILFEPQSEDGYREPGALTVLTQVMSEISPDLVPESTLYRAMREMYLVAESHWTAESESVPLLEELKKVGYGLGIISNAADHENVENILKNANLTPYFDCVISSAQFGTGKPGTEIFSHALQLLKAKPESSIMVGDKLQADILGANRMGMRGLWVTRRVKTITSPITDPMLQPWKTVGNLKHILPLLKM